MIVPFVDLKRQYASIQVELNHAIQQVIDESAFVGGRHVRQFEQNFAKFLGSQHCVGVGNGTDALFVALKCLGIADGDEVITAANSFIATSEAITLTGARVVFVDCEEGTYNISPEGIRAALTNRTKAIVPVHLYGQPADMANIAEIAKEHGLSIVEDAAQAHGAKSQGRCAGTLGDLGCFSFYPGKNLGAYGDGGAIVTDREDIARKARMFADHGRMTKYNHEFEGTNSRLDGLQAAILDVKLRHLDQWTRRRREIAKMYDAALGGIATTPQTLPGAEHVYHLYVLRIPERDRVMAFLKERGVASGVHYPTPLPQLEAYRYLDLPPTRFPVANSIKDELISLPIHGLMTDQEVEYVIDCLQLAAGAE